jgi:hypothetical protein
LHEESFAGNMSSSTSIREVCATYALLLYQLNINTLRWCHPFIIRVQYFGFVFGHVEFPLPIYSSRIHRTLCLTLHVRSKPSCVNNIVSAFAS